MHQRGGGGILIKIGFASTLSASTKYSNKLFNTSNMINLSKRYLVRGVLTAHVIALKSSAHWRMWYPIPSPACTVCWSSPPDRPAVSSYVVSPPNPEKKDQMTKQLGKTVNGGHPQQSTDYCATNMIHHFRSYLAEFFDHRVEVLLYALHVDGIQGVHLNLQIL